MSARSGITKSLAQGLATSLDGTGYYVNNLYGNVGNNVAHFDEVDSYPYISVTPGPEQRDDMPSNISMANLTVYIRIYVESEDNAQDQLESIISDIETFVDTHLNLSYNINTSNGVETRQTVLNSIVSITTDEGLFRPNGVGEIVLDVQYEKTRKF